MTLDAQHLLAFTVLAAWCAVMIADLVRASEEP